MNKVELKMGECFVTNEPSIIEFKGCGNSIVVCMFEDYSKIGGMGHVMVPGKGIVYRETPMRYSDKVIQYMVDKIEGLGGIKRRIQTKIIGGAVLFQRFPETNSNGEKIVVMVKKRLMQKKISVTATDIGGCFGRSITFDTGTGKAGIKKSNGERYEI
ncbi:MAG: chemotaxis protein CheD [Candidatus Aenigmarchaeota archaeon]|nr:chemotaxis protein CheD [Candidatus Aenigmarchaeota archaeon]